MNLGKLNTEKINPKTVGIDMCSSLEIACLMNKEDETVANAIRPELPQISKLVDAAYPIVQKNGRIFYMGTGSSGRLGVLDASEIPPTFNLMPNQFIGIIAGGDEALRTSKPTVEDSESEGMAALKAYSITSNDLVIGLTASGRTPFVKGALQYAASQQAFTGLICCNKNAEISPFVNVAVEIDTGPEVIAGSTRLKAGTAQKMALNIFSTATMIKAGKVYKNLMVDLVVSNEKLQDRAIRIIVEATGATYEEAAEAFRISKEQVKTAIVYLLTGEPVEEILVKLEENKGKVRDVLDGLGYGG
ncbi:N-acetylmuramic acid 6-phosphate etherase [Sporosarcina thermotolerans]|uniref:N-acetylmuramic acid 6-phosphate etherase n=1 Tax=Sporosarcina thermotolerans TaxID=633404 RepID=A0AAW9AAE1_9BACL|nr:N-acetylmuramic acid 6-phosphate etherase [Sporosarcina thermotolerans]MDW0116156.1 N-acetylmuramic acid 6-phosphate etherase [Sporosarcina thermotolerans]WHT48127.1 N-acetylmuramic acid 6-phosphate etherase [Sporosarcina thermotolerans]